jgi:hypothetical protein
MYGVTGGTGELHSPALFLLEHAFSVMLTDWGNRGQTECCLALYRSSYGFKRNPVR